MLDEICGRILGDLVFLIIVMFLVDLGMSESQAEGTVFFLAICLAILFILRETRRRKALGKAVVLDTDGDGQISEEEWAAAGMENENDEVGVPEKDWWGTEEE